MFFAPTGNAADPNGGAAFPSSVIYSMGPNGWPGDGSQQANVNAYTREYTFNSPGPDALGQDDDLMVEF